MFPGPLPLRGKEGDITLHGIPLMLEMGTYVRGEAKPFGEKVSTGSLKYSDLTPNRSTHAQATFTGGYGLRRYSDHPDANLAATMYLEGEGVDCGEDGLVVNGPLVSEETLPWDGADTQGSPVWFGEFTPTGGSATWLCVAGSAIFSRDTNGDWTRELALPAVAKRDAVGVFGADLIIGYGATRTAQYTANLTSLSNVVDTAGPTALYVFALTADRAAAYIAGGTAATDVNEVMSSAVGGTAYASSVVCGSTASSITALAPGGGLVILYVGKETELGMINSSGTYQVLKPFDSRLSTNCQSMRWYLSAGHEAQRGPVVLFFPRDRALWTYQPQSDQTGVVQNVSPWAMPGSRPPNVRGLPTAIQGTARWLYYAIQNSAGTVWLNKTDSRTGRAHTWAKLGASKTCNAMGVTTLLSTNPLLIVGYGSHVASIILPLDGDSPVDDTACRFNSSATLDLPDIDMNFPTEDKIAFGVTVVADDLSDGIREIDVYVRYDGGSNVLLGTVVDSPSTRIEFSEFSAVKRLGLRLVLRTTTSTICAKLRGYSVDLSINPRVYNTWAFQARLPGGTNTMLGDDLQNPYTILGSLWAARRTGTPIEFVDRYNDVYSVRITDIVEREIVREPSMTPETILELGLLEFSTTAAAEVTYAATVGTAAFFPIFPFHMYASTLDTSDTITNPGTSIIYPQWVVTGPGGQVILTNSTTGETFTLAYELLPGQSITIDTDPTRQTVIDQDSASQVASVVSGSTYWGLAAGANSIRVQLSKTTGDSSIKLVYRRGAITT